MKIVDITEANASLAEYTSGLSGEPVIITNNGEPIAALVNLENVDFETISLSSNPKFIEMPIAFKSAPPKRRWYF
ncbi:hypothetical protein NIES4071_79530 [Calothrix sp. NIES-4071]|nr:hypothetical protein NIES4071_79530 [Calothrix sp. NIES-4071]BAZ62223.1 hypothetical protein NIES4105_79460 [Calothrix sp. NIES-4105]